MDKREVAVVTGAASGVGAATTTRLLRKGFGVIGVDLAAMPAGRFDGSADLVWVRGDVSQTATWTEVITRSTERFATKPQVLVANAAHLVVGTVTSLSDDDWKAVFDVNVFGVVRALRACIPGMIEQGYGRIVTVASVDAYMAEQGLAAYCSSKGALAQLTRCTAMDYARDGITVNCVCPGVIDTPFFRRHLDTAKHPASFLRVREQRNPLGRLLDPDEVAATVVFLASKDASGMTGSLVTVDAGLSASFDFRTGEEGA
jgi:NAD(P)-dependent dehydrogenase (short-subunit alcohol dehydrogenase family)